MFNEYWKTKAAKRRKKVFTPLDYNNTFSFEDYKVAHLVEHDRDCKVGFI